MANCARLMKNIEFIGRVTNCLPKKSQLQIGAPTSTSRSANGGTSWERRGDGRQSRPHKPALFERKRVCGRMCRARRKEPPGACLRGGGRVSSGNGSCAFLLRAFSFAHQKKMLKNNDEFYVPFVGKGLAPLHQTAQHKTHHSSPLRS